MRPRRERTRGREDPSIGRTLSHCRVEDRLGAGGMGVVCLARAARAAGRPEDAMALLDRARHARADRGTAGGEGPGKDSAWVMPLLRAGHEPGSPPGPGVLEALRSTRPSAPGPIKKASLSKVPVEQPAGYFRPDPWK